MIEGVLTDVYSILEKIAEELGLTEDIEDTLRILKNFDAHYSSLRRKFKEYITPRKNERDLLLGRVIVDKIRLRVENNQKIVTIVFDKRVNPEYILRLVS
ncbi:MAG: hypothetical protein QN229_00500 [Desulfurococcaceae archaeon TW002]